MIVDTIYSNLIIIKNEELLTDNSDLCGAAGEGEGPERPINDFLSQSDHIDRVAGEPGGTFPVIRSDLQLHPHLNSVQIVHKKRVGVR